LHCCNRAFPPALDHKNRTLVSIALDKRSSPHKATLQRMGDDRQWCDVQVLEAVDRGDDVLYSYRAHYDEWLRIAVKREDEGDETDQTPAETVFAYSQPPARYKDLSPTVIHFTKFNQVAVLLCQRNWENTPVLIQTGETEYLLDHLQAPCPLLVEGWDTPLNAHVYPVSAPSSRGVLFLWDLPTDLKRTHTLTGMRWTTDCPQYLTGRYTPSAHVHDIPNCSAAEWLGLLQRRYSQLKRVN
jgi:hypothetical protein